MTGSRNRSALLARWRGAVAVVHEPGSEAPSIASESPAAPLLAPNATSEAALFSLFEAEILSAVARPMADALLRILAAPRTAVLTERSAVNRAEILARLELVEDVLDAVLLAGAGQSDVAEEDQQSP